MRSRSRRIGRASWIAPVVALASFLAAATPSFSQSPPPVQKAPDLTKVPTLYEVGYTHLDTEWCWLYPQVINEFIPNTLHQNFAMLDNYPDYVFNWTGANRYKFMKEYYPADYAKLKTYITAGRWVTGGSSLEEGDVDIPSEESIIRHVMYGNEYFENEFGTDSTDFMLPDCFGFPGDLPSILNHCGILGFSTQKLTWGSAVGIPFNLGKWIGTDNTWVYGALNAGNYDAPLDNDASNDAGWLARVNADGAKSGIYADFNYYGIGDRGGSVRESDAQNLEKSLHGGGPLTIVSSREDQVFNDLQNYDTSKLPTYKGDLLLTWHTSGSSTSQAEQKRWNHQNEKLADATERASVVANWLGALPYDKLRITDAWWKFLPGQFHDLMAGTALPMAYEYSWNDEVLALNEFAGQLQEAVGGTARAIDTQGTGVPIIVYNPLSVARQDVVEATATFPGPAPESVAVTSPSGTVVPSQIESRLPGSVKLLFLASAPSVGYSVYFVKSAAPSQPASPLAVSVNGLSNQRYRVTINSAGDISSVYDKAAGKELLASPLRFSFQYENPSQYPAWNMDYSDQTAPPEGYVDGPAKISVVENGPVRVAVQVERWARGSHFVTTYSLAAGKAGDRVEVRSQIDWMTPSCALMAVMPLTVSAPSATYNWELGTIVRPNDDPTKYEVPSHQWFDVTDTSGAYGVSVLQGDRYGSDKPNDNTVRLTLLYTPGIRGGYTHQKSNDWGHHDLSFAIAGHVGSWVKGGTQWESIRFDRPLIAFQAPAHPGALGSSFSFVHLNNPNVSIEALKQAERSHEIVVRFNELAGVPETNVLATFASPIISAREVNGQEAPVGPATIENGALVFNMDAYRPRAFAIRLAAPSASLMAPTSTPVALAYNVDVTKPFGAASGGSFDDNGNAIPEDMLYSSVENDDKVHTSIVSDGISFKLPAPGSALNAVEANGQKIGFPAAGAGSKLYLLAASSDGDANAAFVVGGKMEPVTIQAWDGKIGQWDDRQWGGELPTLTYDMTNPLIGIKPGYIKRATVAWYSDHVRAADGSNQAYSYCYLYRYALDLPVGARSVTLPNDPRIKIVAATLAADPNAATTPAQYLYDTLEHPTSYAPHVESIASADGSGQTVDIVPPLYFSADAALHYTLDGSEPMLSSATYVQPFTLTEPAHVKAAYIDSSGNVEGVKSVVVSVSNPTAPQVTAVKLTNPTTLVLMFSEPVSSATATSATNYSFSPTNNVSSAVLAPDAESVTLTLGSPEQNTAQSTVSVAGVTSAVANGMAVSGASSLPIPQANVVYQSDAVQSFDGTTNGFSKDVAGLPTNGSASWTINLFAYFNATPGELTTLAGFGDDQDNAGTQRYILKFHDGIHFWGSNIDVTSGVPYDLAKWQMITATYDGTTLTLYKNAQVIKTAPIALNPAASTVKIAPPGPWANGNKLNGKIAGLRIYDSALSADQITALMASEPTN